MPLPFIKHNGSEFDVVIMVIPPSAPVLLTRNLLYTGITRAKKKLILLGEPQAFLESIKNNQEQIRKTTLKERLKQKI